MTIRFFFVWGLAVMPALAANPVIFYSDLVNGPKSGGRAGNGAIVTIYGRNLGASRGSSTVTIGGGNAAYYGPSDGWWSDTQISFELGAAAVTGNIVANVSSVASNGVPFTVNTTGNIYFVGPGSNGDGSFATPWNNVESCASTVVAGDTCYLLDGYIKNTRHAGISCTAALVMWHAAGTATKNVAFVGYPGATATIDGSTVGGPSLRFSCGFGSADVSYTTIANLHIFNSFGYEALEIYGGPSDHSRVVGNDISCTKLTTQTGCAIYGFSNYHQYYGNRMHDNSTADATGTVDQPAPHAVYFTQNAEHDMDVGWNIWEHNRNNKSLQFHSSTGGIDSGVGLNMYNIKVHDNIFSDQTSGAVTLASINPSKGSVDVWNNVFYRVGVNNNGPLISANAQCAVEVNSQYQVRKSLPGTINGTSGSKNVVGVGTHFTTDLAAWDAIWDAVSGWPNGFVVESIQDDTHLTLYVASPTTFTGTSSSRYEGSVGTVHIFNNSMYSIGEAHQALNVVGGLVCKDGVPGTPALYVDVRNNIGYQPVVSTYGERYMSFDNSVGQEDATHGNTETWILGDHNLWFGLAGGSPVYGSGAGAHDMHANPLYQSVSLSVAGYTAGANMHLQAGSPALNAGEDTAATTDMDGAPRAPGAFSLGAFQGPLGCTVALSSTGPFTVGQSPAITASVTNCGAGTLTWTSSGLPTGLVGCNGVTGATCPITGTTSAAGTFTPTISVTDGGTNSANSHSSIVVNAAPATSVSPTSLPSGTVSTPYGTQTLTAANFTGTVTWSLLTGTLPNGLAGCASGTGTTCSITGTPTTTAGSPFSFTIRATDGTSTVDTPYTVTISSAAGPPVGGSTVSGKAVIGGRIAR